MADKKEKDYKKAAPENFVTTELGSAVFANVGGRPGDEEFLIEDEETEKVTGRPGAEKLE